MNIFVVDQDPMQAGRDLCNKHIVKMIIETAQILSTVMHLRDVEGPYKSTHVSHPCVKWAAMSVNNSQWSLRHGLSLLDEYTKRYQKTHACVNAFEQIMKKWGTTWSAVGNWNLHTEFVQCMPDQYKSDDAVTAYRNFYINEKARFAKWAPRSAPPTWWPFSE